MVIASFGDGRNLIRKGKMFIKDESKVVSRVSGLKWGVVYRLFGAPQRISTGFPSWSVTATTSLNGSQPNFARCLVAWGVSQTLRRWLEGATYIRQGGHHILVNFMSEGSNRLCILSSCFLSPMSKNSVLEELRVRRLRTTITNYRVLAGLAWAPKRQKNEINRIISTMCSLQHANQREVMHSNAKLSCHNNQKRQFVMAALWNRASIIAGVIFLPVVSSSIFFFYRLKAVVKTF